MSSLNHRPIVRVPHQCLPKIMNRDQNAYGIQQECIHDLLYTQINSVVCVQMVLYISPTKGSVRTQRTRERFFSSVDTQVLIKIGLIPSLIRAMRAREWLHSCVCSAVLYEVTTIYSAVITVCTLIQSWQFPAVGKAVLDSHGSSTACHVTGIIQQHLQEM